jgi:hypothetical protein
MAVLVTLEPTPPKELCGVKPGVVVWPRPLALGLKSFATSTPLPSVALSSSKSLSSSSSSRAGGAFDVLKLGNEVGAPVLKDVLGTLASEKIEGGCGVGVLLGLAKSGGKGAASGTTELSLGFETFTKSGGRGASPAALFSDDDSSFRPPSLVGLGVATGSGGKGASAT